MRHDDDRDDIWSLPSSELAARCGRIADDTSLAHATLREEARRLYIEWQAALHLPHEEFGEHARQASILAALRKRTIEIILKTRTDSATTH